MSIRLKSIQGTELTEYAIKLLNNNKIYTVIEFLEASPIKLSKYINLPVSKIVALKKILSRGCLPNSVCPVKKYTELIKSSPFVTGIQSLDSMLNGELVWSSLVEVCGLPAAGKSYLACTIALNLAQTFNFQSLFIDTKNDFSGARFNKLLVSRGCSEKDMAAVMQKIFVRKCFNATDMVKYLKELEKSSEILSKIKLIVIDSMPAIWFLYHGQKSVEGIALLAETTNLLRKISQQYGILVMVVNIVTRWIELELEENISDKSQTTIKPSLGKYWETVPSLRLLIDEISPAWKMSSPEVVPCETSDESQRFVKILKSNCYETGKCCTVTLTDKGVI